MAQYWLGGSHEMSFPNAVQKRPGAIVRTGSAVRSYWGSKVNRTGITWAREAYGLGKAGGLARVLGVAYLGYTAYTGYKEGGGWGAAKAIGKGAAEMYAQGAVWGAIGTPVMYGAAAVAGAGAVMLGLTSVRQNASISQMVTRPWVRDHMRKHAKMEMARPVIDQFGNTATMRRRSLAAIQGSKLNGRTGLGNEATLMYRPYFR